MMSYIIFILTNYCERKQLKDVSCYKHGLTWACMTEVNLELWFSAMNLSPACLAPIIPPKRKPVKEANNTVVGKSRSSSGRSSPYLHVCVCVCKCEEQGCLYM